MASGRENRLELLLLGTPEVRLSGDSVKLRTKKALALLAFLALEGGVQPRARLTALLWPELPETQGRGNLRNTIGYLREALGDAALVIERDALGLALGFALDHALLEDAFRLTSDERLTNATLARRLQSAVAAYRGELLEAFTLPDAPEFDDWAAARREVARQWLDGVLERSLNLHAELGELDAALELSRRRLRLEPLNEVAHRQLMQLHLDAGNRAAALEAYRACRQVLQRELGIEPSPETQALAAKLRSTPTVVLEKPSDVPLRPTDWSGTLQAHGLEGPMLAGREREWAALEASWQAGQVIYISGEPGAGKSRLALEFARSRGQFETLRGRPTDAAVPYAIIARALRTVAQLQPEIPMPDWARRELSRLVPEWSSGDAPPVRSEGEQLRLFDAFVEWGLTAFRHHAAIVLDDLQFWDLPSFEMGAYGAVRALERTGDPLRTIVVLRRGELPAGIEARVRRQVESGRAAMIELEPLDAGGVRSLVTNLLPHLGAGQAAAVSESLQHFTGGNVLFVLETVRTLLESNELEAFAEGLKRRLPRSERVGHVIARRFEALSKEARHLARVAAVSGEDFSLTLASEVLEANEFALLDANEELEAAGILRAGRFGHDLLHETVREGIPAAARALLHRRVLVALERQGGVAPATLAMHAFEAGRTDALLLHSLAAGDTAFKLYAMPEAIQHYERARAALTALHAGQLTRGLTASGLQAQDVQRLYNNLGYAYNYTQQTDQALLVFQEMLDFGRATQSGVIACTALNRLADHARDEDLDLELADALYREALETAEREQDVIARVETLVSLGWLEEQRWRLDAALEYALEAVSLARGYGDPEWVIEALWTLFNIELDLGRYGDARRNATAMHALALAHGARVAQAHAQAMIAYCQYFLGDAQVALRDAQAARDLAVEIAYSAGEGFALRVQALALLDVGEARPALELAERGLRVARERQRPFSSVYALIAVARARMALGEWRAAREALSEALQVGRSLRDKIIQVPLAEAHVHALLSAVNMVEGQWSEAAQHARMALECREANREYAGWFIWTPRFAEAEALLRAGEPLERVQADLEHFAQHTEGNPKAQLTVLRTQAVLARWQGLTETALEHLETAGAIAVKLGLVAELQQIELEAFAINTVGSDAY